MTKPVEETTTVLTEISFVPNHAETKKITKRYSLPSTLFQSSGLQAQGTQKNVQLGTMSRRVGGFGEGDISSSNTTKVTAANMISPAHPTPVIEFIPPAMDAYKLLENECAQELSSINPETWCPRIATSGKQTQDHSIEVWHGASVEEQNDEDTGPFSQNPSNNSTGVVSKESMSTRSVDGQCRNDSTAKVIGGDEGDDAMPSSSDSCILNEQHLHHQQQSSIMKRLSLSVSGLDDMMTISLDSYDVSDSSFLLPEMVDPGTDHKEAPDGGKDEDMIPVNINCCIHDEQHQHYQRQSSIRQRSISLGSWSDDMLTVGSSDSSDIFSASDYSFLFSEEVHSIDGHEVVPDGDEDDDAPFRRSCHTNNEQHRQ